MIQWFERHKAPFSIGLIWLVHLSGIIGISLGFEEWFVGKTWMNLLLTFVLVLWNYPTDNTRKILLAFILATIGIAAEWIGVHTGFPFGAYTYGENLGWKLDGVPYLIGTNWAVLTLCSASLANRISRNRWTRVFVGASLMVAIDLLLEPVAPMFDYWTFTNGAPLENYIAWFVLSVLLHLVLTSTKIKDHGKLSIHVYLATLIYFAYFYVFFSI